MYLVIGLKINPKIIFIYVKKMIERIFNPISKLILLEIIGLAISYIFDIIGACMSDYDYVTYMLFSSLEFMFLRL